MHGTMSCGGEAMEAHSSDPLPGLYHRIASKDYRAKVSQIILEIRAEYGLTQEDLAEKIGVSETTISNAERQLGNLDAVAMLNLGVKFGGARRLAPIIALVNGNPEPELTRKQRFQRLRAELDDLERGE